MKILVRSFFLMIFVFTSVPTWAADNSFPGRVEKKYKDVPVFEMKQLYEMMDKVVIVDTRSSLEYETLHIKGAYNIPVASNSFEQDLLKFREKTDKPIVFYCNGRTCYKSYIAVTKAMKINVDDTHAYDAGVFEWARAYPKNTILLGKSLVDANELITKDHYESKLLDPETFSIRVSELGRKALVLDVRDKFQRAGIGFFPGNERWVSLDQREKLGRYIKQAVDKQKVLFIYDEVGKQVRWVQYALEQAGLKKYYFMDKGAKGYYAMLASPEWNVKH
jgi:rhodanese-related sulfurtransferase